MGATHNNGFEDKNIHFPNVLFFITFPMSLHIFVIRSPITQTVNGMGIFGYIYQGLRDILKYYPNILKHIKWGQ